MAPSSHIITELHSIINVSSDPSKYPVGVLTSEHRDTWAKGRERLVMGEWFDIGNIATKQDMQSPSVGTNFPRPILLESTMQL